MLAPCGHVLRSLGNEQYAKQSRAQDDRVEPHTSRESGSSSDRLPRVTEGPRPYASDLDPRCRGAETRRSSYWLADRYPRRAGHRSRHRRGRRCCLSWRRDLPATPIGVHFRVLVLRGCRAGVVRPGHGVRRARAHRRLPRAAPDLLQRAADPEARCCVHVPRDRWLTLATAPFIRFADEDAWQINPGHVRMGYSLSPRDAIPPPSRGRVPGARRPDLGADCLAPLAHVGYSRLEHPTPPASPSSIPVTDACSWLDARHPDMQATPLFAHAVKPGELGLVAQDVPAIRRLAHDTRASAAEHLVTLRQPAARETSRPSASRIKVVGVRSTPQRADHLEVLLRVHLDVGHARHQAGDLVRAPGGWPGTARRTPRRTAAASPAPPGVRRPRRRSARSPRPAAAASASRPAAAEAAVGRRRGRRRSRRPGAR